MAVGEKVRITDLAAPVLLENQAAAIAWAEANPVVVSEDAILAEAQRQAGLTDFGENGFRARLHALVAAINADTDLNELGRRSCFDALVRYLRNKLDVEDVIRRHPEIEQIMLDPPVLIAGLPRSGTTFLQQIMSADPRLRPLPYWEAIRPVAAPYIVDDVDTRWQRAQDAWEEMDRISPFVKMIHEFTPDHMSEDVELIDIDLGTYTLEWLAHLPGWRDYQHTHDMTPCLAYLSRVERVMTWQTGGSRRWVTKCPQHMERLAGLHSVYPDATFLIMHRDPVASIQSAITAIGSGSRLTRRTVDLQAIADYWIDRYVSLLQGCVAQRDALDESRSLDMYFHDLMADPKAALAPAYDKAGLPFDREAQAAIDVALSANQRGRHGQLVYDLRADFGLDPADVRKRFDFYFDRFPGVRVEVR